MRPCGSCQLSALDAGAIWSGYAAASEYALCTAITASSDFMGFPGQKTDTTRLTPQRLRVINVLESAPLCLLQNWARAGVSSSVIKAYRGGVLSQTSQPRAEKPTHGYPLTTPYKLTSTQQSIADNIDSLSKCFGVHLIDGITGSGKQKFISIR